MRARARALISKTFCSMAFVSLCSAGAYAQSVAPAPAPSASPLREIGHVTTNSICTALSKGVAPILFGVSRNDEAIGASHRGLSKMDSDTALHSSEAALEFDKRYLLQVADVLGHNLDTIKKILASAAFPRTISDSDDQAVAILKQHLEDVAAKQREALNLVTGTVETSDLGQMQTERNSGMDSATSGDTSTPAPLPAETGDNSFLSVAGLNSSAAGTTDLRTTAGTTLGHTMYATIVRQLEGTQLHVAYDEHQVDRDVVTAVAMCKSETQAQPAPSPSPSP